MGGLGESFNASQWTLQSTLEPAHLYKHNLLFSWDVSDDTRNSSLRVLSVSPVGALDSVEVFPVHMNPVFVSN